MHRSAFNPCDDQTSQGFLQLSDIILAADEKIPVFHEGTRWAVWALAVGPAEPFTLISLDGQNQGQLKRVQASEITGFAPPKLEP